MPNIAGQQLKFNLYHYTDINALIKILGKDRIVLWATNITYLNDSHELTEGIEVISEVHKELLHPGAFRSYYITSFSSNKDSLSMWGMYAANGYGFALGFDFDELSNKYPILTRCIYGKENVKESFTNTHTLIQSGTMVNFATCEPSKMSKENEQANRKALAENNIIVTCLSAKNEAYLHEAEMRGVIYCNECSRIYFRTRNGYIVPYIEVELPKSALKEIIIGPTDNSDLKELSILHFLQINGYNLNEIKVTRSKIPYRG